MNNPQNPQGPKDPLLLDHEADGIQELDNNLPRWWVWLFVLCVAFGFVYLGWYHVLGKGDLQIAEYQAEMARGDAIKKQAMAAFESTIATAEPSKDQAVVGHGRELFATYCAPCHRADGGGLVGPNLCDDYWIHGDKYADNLRTIWNGVTDKGMLSWRDQGMPPQDILAVASYIYTLRGTKPPNPKIREDQAPVQTGPNEFE